MSCSRAARRARVAAHRSSTKHVGRLFPGSILGLPAARETMGARAEVILASAPVLELRLGRAQHHRVVPRSLPVAPAVSAILAGAKSDFMSSDWPGQPRARTPGRGLPRACPGLIWAFVVRFEGLARQLA